MIYYAKSTGGFYTSAIHGDNIPSDAVEITAEEHQFLLEGQSSGKIISPDSEGRPVLINPATATTEQMWSAIKAERDRRTQEGGYKVPVESVDKWFHSDTISRSQQTDLVLAGDTIPDGLQWKTMDGTFVTMTAVLANQVRSAATASDIAIFSVAEVHKAAMLAAEVPADYDYSGGWPVIYSDVTAA